MKRVLFVEDEPWGVDAYFLQLRRHGFDCELARTFDEAVAKLNLENYDILSLDIMLTRDRRTGESLEDQSAGFKLLQQIRSGKVQNCDAKLKVMVLTALANAQIERRIKELDVAAFLIKPVSSQKVIETLSQSVHDGEKR